MTAPTITVATSIFWRLALGSTPFDAHPAGSPPDPPPLGTLCWAANASDQHVVLAKRVEATDHSLPWVWQTPDGQRWSPRYLRYWKSAQT